MTPEGPTVLELTPAEEWAAANPPNRSSSAGAAGVFVVMLVLSSAAFSEYWVFPTELNAGFSPFAAAVALLQFVIPPAIALLAYRWLRRLTTPPPADEPRGF